MPNELVTSLGHSMNIGYVTIICYPIVKGYIAKSTEYEKDTHYTVAEKQTDIDVSEVMEFVRFFTVILFIASFLMLYFYGGNISNPIAPIVMEMFILAAFLYLGHDVVWLIIGLLWFTGWLTHEILMEIQKTSRQY